MFPSQTTVQTLVVYNVLQGLYTGYIQVFWQPFLLLIGVSVVEIGLLEWLAGRSGILASVVQVFGGRLSDRVGRRRLVITGSGLLVACWSLATAAFLFRKPVFIPGVYVAWSLSAAALPVLDALLADNVVERRRSRVYSQVLLANSLPGAATGFAAGLLVSALGPAPLLGTAAVLEGCGLVLLWRRLRGNGVSQLEAQAEKEASRLRDVFSNASKHWRLFSVFAADSLGWSTGFTLLYALLRAVQGYTSPELGAIAATMPLGMVAGSIPGGWLTHEIGPKRLLVASEVMGALVWAAWGFYPVPTLAPVYAFVWGMAITTWVPVQFHVLTHVFPAEHRGELLGAVATFRGLVATLGPVAATVLYVVGGYRAPFVGAVVGVSLAVVFIVKFIPDTPPRPDPSAGVAGEG